MIISDKYKYIFLHVPKTGGSSVAVYLSQFLGPKDLMLDAWNDALRMGVPYNQRVYDEINNNYGMQMVAEAVGLRSVDGKIFERPIIDYALRKVVSKRLGTDSVHAPAANVRKMEPEKWDQYFKFAFVRNPFTHAVSFWRWNEKDWSLAFDAKSGGKTKQASGKFLDFLL